MTNVFIMGLGKIGYNTAMYYMDNGCTVFGWDIDESARIEALSKGVVVFKYLEEYNWEEMDVISVCVPTKAVYDAVRALETNFHLTELCPLLMIESTVVPSTCDKIAAQVFKHKMGVAHVPQRYWEEDPHKRGVRRKRLVAASDDETFVRAIKFLKDVNMTVFPTYGLEVAELAKVAENAYRNLMISYAEELYGVCKELEIDFWAVKEAIETHQTIGYMLEPREGVGGHCLPMAAEIMQDLSSYNDIIIAAQVADVKYRKLIGEEK